MIERITEAELALVAAHPSSGYEAALVAEVRRLRGLIVAGTPEGWSQQPGFNDLLAEARALREEQG